MNKNKIFFKSEAILAAILDYLISKSMHLFTYLPSFIIVEKSEHFFPK